MLYTLIGTKVGMTSVYGKDNTLIPVTVIQAGPCPVTQVRTSEVDGYHAVQIGYGKRKASRTSQAMAGHFQKSGVEPQQHVVEIRAEAPVSQKPGDVLTVAEFKEGALVDVIGTSKGHGFQGVMKRHNMDGQPATHGHMMHRRPGSIGCRQFPGHVFKGKRMPGHMGDVQRTQQNLLVVQVLAEKNLILVRGSIPGATGTTVLVRASKKSAARVASGKAA